MSEEWRDLEEIKQLKARYFRFIDTQDWPGLRSLFAPNAAIAFPEANVTYDNGDAFVDWAEEVLVGVVSVHAGYMPEIALTGDGTATGIWAMTDDLDAPNGLPQEEVRRPMRMRGAGHYHERYRKIDGEWKIAEMMLKRLRLDID